MTMPATISATVEVSLDGTGAYTGAADDVTAAIAVEPGISIEEGREGSRALMPPKVPTLEYELHNESGAYSQENPGSSVYQLLIPGRPTRVTATHGDERPYDDAATDYDADVYYDGAAVWTIASGAVDDIHQTTEWGARRVGLDNLGTMSMLVGQRVTVAVQANIRTDVAIGLLLDAAGWPADKRAISIGDTTLLYWWCDDRSPWEAMLEILASEGPCQLYQDAQGVIHFENRNYRTITSRSTTSQASFLDHDTGSGLWFTGLNYEPGYKNIYNRATFSTRRRALGALAKVWEYGASLVLTANQSITLIARPSDPFQAAVTPVAATDYTVSAGSLSSVTLSATSGLVAFLTIVAGAGGATVNGVTSTGIQLRAQPLTVVSETVIQNSVDASASIAKFSPIPGANVPRTLNVQGWPETEPTQAEAVCNSWVNRYKEQRPQVTIAVRNADAAHVWQILERQISDRITLTETNTGLAAAVWIETKSTRISGAHGRTVECVLGCELIDTLAGAVWGVSVWDNAAAVWGI